MGRKIPAKKHRGVKDPLLQQAQRLKSLKGKINAPPKDVDDQPVPKSLIELFSFQNKDTKKEKKKNQNKHLQHKQQQGAKIVKNANNPIGSLRRLPGEDPRAFSLRINGAMRALHDHSPDYMEDMEEEDYKGQRMAAQRERREKKRERAERDAARQARRAGEPPPAPLVRGKLARKQKLADKKKEKMNKLIETQREESLVRYERVQFGDVAHAPPALTAPRRAHCTVGADRPGRRNLLLSTMLSGSAHTAPHGSASGAASSAATADKLRRERDRLQAVEAYRALKANKLKDKKRKIMLL